jgi:hypothetical protein
MIFLYLISIIPAIVGIVLYVCNKKVVWLEWLGSVAIALFFSAVMHILVIYGTCKDVQTLSGQISKATHYPEWIEEYTETHTETDDEGNVTTSTDTHHRTHDEEWKASTTLGDEYDITKDFFSEISENFHNLTTERPYKDGFDSGDPNIYVAYNNSKFVYPVTSVRIWKNKVKAAPSVFSFVKVSKNIAVYEYPPNGDWLRSDRLLGNVPINLLEFDRMNSRLGPLKKVNVIIVYFGNKDSSMGKWQQAKWIGGKKNDLVICYGGEKNNKADWSFCFGWTEKEIVKRNLETIFIDNKIDSSIIPKIEQEVRKNYQIKDWSKFDYITINPPIWSYFVLIILIIISEIAFWYWAIGNEFEKRK